MKITRTPTTPDEALAVRAIKSARMIPASWEKRFTAQLSPDFLSEKERPQLWRLFQKYRRQIAGANLQGVMMTPERMTPLLSYAATHAAPDFRKSLKAEEIKLRLQKMREEVSGQNKSDHPSPPQPSHSSSLTQQTPTHQDSTPCLPFL